jgi:Dehydrogenases with different specificities (related to short-chain alcohol dehydrogenases)
MAISIDGMISVQQLMSLKGRTALITGGGGHIGLRIADALAELGCHIALIDLEKSDVKSAADAIAEKHQVKTMALSLDLTDTPKVRETPAKAAATLGSLDILINCASFTGTAEREGWRVPFVEQGLEAWRDCLEVNLTACMVLSQAATPFLKQSGHGSIINIGSIYGFVAPDLRMYEGTAMQSVAAYAASKGGLLQLTRWLSTILAPEVRVNCMSPGGVWRSQPEVFVERYSSRTPLKRMGNEDDFVGAIVFLASDLSSYVTGQHLAVDGGFSVW